MAWYQTFLVTLVGILLVIKCTPNADCSIDPSSITERPNEDVVLRCTCRNVDVTAYSIEWCLQQQCPLQSNADYSTVVTSVDAQEKYSILTVIYAQIDDSHTYYCEVNGTIVAQADINIVEVPVTDLLPDDASITYGESTNLTCELRDSNDQLVNATGPVIWRKNNMKIIADVDNDGEVDLHLTDNQLMIIDAESADGGVYSCGLDNQILPVKDEVVIETAAKINKNYSVKATVGSKVTLTCSATGYPLASLLWKDHSGSEETDLLSSKSTSSLVFPSVKKSDDGIYQCSATNGIGETENTYITLSIDSSVWRVSPSAWTSIFSLIIMYACINYISLTSN
ncbi:Down syndrome cell adhesion molecule-like protein 1 [Anneissia japonica]|uniref:Down syndrome cell adhesion molecule-like protein 1 n=1 Tax=Anneissia japonica TaxID=1529436 RepID=UPI0014258823|nr:Down syndrome cell adhesion molecule-like protein 1 [Anneissia japonica]